MNNSIKYLDIKELLSDGFLFEINRKVLHPHGMALEVRVEEDGTMSLGGIWDYRDDPEGITFGDDLVAAGKEKFQEYMERAGDEKVTTRLKALGYVIQGENE